VAKAATYGADVVILDLEDSVPLERKAAARATIPAVTAALGQQACPLVIRINTMERDEAVDLAVAVRRGVTAFMVPKVEIAARLALAGLAEAPA
jgi:citrate lyase subunit beta/citryl-CoA lyase